MAKTKEPVEVDSSEEEEAYEVEKILKHKIDKDENGKDIVVYKIRWLGFKAADDTWEPRVNIEEGAKSVLDAYHAKAARDGDPVVEPSELKKKKPRASEPVKRSEPVEKKKPRASEIKVPESRDSTSSTRKTRHKEDLTEVPVSIDTANKKSSKSRVVEEVPASASSSKKGKAVNGDAAPESASTKRKAPKDVSPVRSESPPLSVARKPVQNGKDSSKEVKEKKVSRKRSADVASDDDHDTAMKVDSAPSKKAKSASEVPEVVVPAGNKVGSRVHRSDDSWEHLLTVDTLESGEGVPGGLKWFVRWHDSEPEFINNETARRKFPQRIIDFFFDHLKFKDTDPDQTGEAMEED